MNEEKEELISELRNFMPAIDDLTNRLIMDMTIAYINDESKYAQKRRYCRHSHKRRRRKR